MPATYIHKYIRLSATFASSIILLTACFDHKQQTVAPPAMHTSVPDPLEVTAFPAATLPPAEEECACFFKSDTLNLRDEYLFVNYSDNRCFLKINGSIIEFRHTLRQVDGSKITLRAVGDQYELKSEFDSIDSEKADKWQYRAVIRVTDKQGQSVLLHLFGSCNC